MGVTWGLHFSCRSRVVGHKSRDLSQAGPLGACSVKEKHGLSRAGQFLESFPGPLLPTAQVCLFPSAAASCLEAMAHFLEESQA